MWMAFRVGVYIILLTGVYAQLPLRPPHLHQKKSLGVISPYTEDLQLVQRAVNQWSQHLPFQAFQVHRVPYSQAAVETAHKNQTALISFVPFKKPQPWLSQASWSGWLQKLNTRYRFHHALTDGQTHTVHNALGRIQAVHIFIRNELTDHQRYFVVLHELGHALGLGHSRETKSVMHASLGTLSITDGNRKQLAQIYAHHTK